jgi:hypothetical protein
MAHTDNKPKTDISCDGNLKERRFKTLLSLLRLGGFPINMKSVSRVRTAYNVFIILCFYITLLCLYVDMFANSNQLVQAMKKYRVVTGMQLIMWMHLSLRYSSTVFF